MQLRHGNYIWVLACLLLFSCRPDDDTSVGDLENILYQPTAYTLKIPKGYPEMEIPADNPMTEEGVKLGRMLFYDPILSLDSTISCSSCHAPELSFTDGVDLSVGINGRKGRRSSMSLLNVGFTTGGLFWDGRSPNLEEQSLHPVEDVNEMGDTWGNVTKKLKEHPEYPQLFREAFGIKNSSDIDRFLVAKALAQFERIIIGSGETEFEKYNRGNYSLEEEADLGKQLFFDDQQPDAECSHCHAPPFMGINIFRNNALDPIEKLEDYQDLGLGAFTKNRFDNGMFRVPSLINVALTAPYMHDGRFKTLEEVIEHYNSGGHRPTDIKEDNIPVEIRPLHLDEEHKEGLIAFLHALTDTIALKNPEIQNPFK